MTAKPEALRLADALDAGENFYAESSMWFDRKLADAAGEAADELRRLHDLLGKSRAINRIRSNRITALETANAELLEALKRAREELRGLPRSLGYEFDHLPTIDAAIAKHRGTTGHNR